MGFLTQQFGFAPNNTVASDLTLGANNPGLVFLGGEVNGLHCEVREVAGALWIVTNAQYSQSGGNWQQVNTAIVSSALVMNPATGVYEQVLESPALGGVLPTITWVLVRGTGQTGKIASQPGVPATGTPLLNPTGQDCTLFVTSNSLSAVSINSQGSGLAPIPASFILRLMAGQTITLVYASAAPTWTWFGG